MNNAVSSASNVCRNPVKRSGYAPQLQDPGQINGPLHRRRDGIGKVSRELEG